MVDCVSSDKLNIDDKFPRRLREFIKNRLKLTQSDFAKKIGITAGYLSMVITGKSGPSAELIAGLCIHYNEYMSWLLTGTEAEKEKKQVEFNTSKLRNIEILNEVEEWLIEEIQKNPGRETWFEFQMMDSFESFKKWKEEKERADRRDEEFPPVRSAAGGGGK